KFAGAGENQLAPKDAQGGRRLTSWTSLAAAGISGALDTLGAIGKGDEALGDLTTARSIADNVRVASTLTDFATPWAQMAETAARSKNHQLTPFDYASGFGEIAAQGIFKTLNIGSASLGANASFSQT